MKAGREKQTSTLEKVESVSKIVGAVSIPIIGLIVTIVLHFDGEANRAQQIELAEKNRQAQLFAEVMSRRESADSDMRASMFSTLLTNYLGALSPDDQGRDNLNDLQRKTVFLKLLISNFQEYFDAKPIFEDLYERIITLSKREGLKGKETERLNALKEDLIGMAKSTAKKQEIMLARIGTSLEVSVKKGNHKCISLYDPYGLKICGVDSELKNLEQEYDGKCTARYGSETLSPPDKKEGQERDERDERDETHYHYSLDLSITEIKDHEVKVNITLYRDYFKDDAYDYSVMEKDNIDFNVSYFDLPFMDNTRLFNGSRFALTLRDILEEGWVNIGIITFREEFMSLRDRPYFEEMLNKLQELSK